MTLYEMLVGARIEGAQEFGELVRQDALLYALNCSTRTGAFIGQAILPRGEDLAAELLRALNIMVRAKKEAEKVSVKWANLAGVPMAIIPGRHMGTWIIKRLRSRGHT